MLDGIEIVWRRLLKSIYISAGKKTLSGSPLKGERWELRTKVLRTERRRAAWHAGELPRRKMAG